MKSIYQFTAACLLAALFFCPSADARERDPKWGACAHTTECVVIPSYCGEWLAINARYKKEAGDWVAEQAMAADCAAAVDTSLQPKAQCVANQCVIKEIKL